MGTLTLAVGSQEAQTLSVLFFSFLDLTTYDTVKHFLLRNTPVEDNSICHGLAR